jgi:putrescine transport system substrate-binding protein
VNGLQRLAFPCLSLLLLGACERAAETGGKEEAVVNVYNWTNGIDPESIRLFEQQTGIKVRYDVFDSNEVLQAKLLAGGSGYDIVVPSGPFLQRMIEAGIFQPLQAGKLPDLGNLDADLREKTFAFDPGGRHSVPYVWTMVGIGYNADKIKQRMPDAPLDSLDMMFKPAVAAKFQDCGIVWVDAPSEIIPEALAYLGLDPNSDNEADLARASDLLLSVAPYVRYINSAKYVDDLSNGETCLVLGWSGDVLLAKVSSERAAREAGRSVIPIEFSVPREGTAIEFDLMAIPSDAPHADNAHKFIQFILQPETAARITNHMTFANANAASWPLLQPEIRDNPDIFPPRQLRDRLWMAKAATPALDRRRTQIWSRLMTDAAKPSSGS